MPQREKIQFNQCTVDLSRDGHISIITPDETLSFDELEERRVFDNNKGETVIEYSGLASDGNTDRSLAKATYQAGGFSQLHYHVERVEDYYILEGRAQVILDGIAHELSVGDCITIPAQKNHEVHNITTENGLLILIVKCTPSWIVEDYNLVNEPACSFHS